MINRFELIDWTKDGRHGCGRVKIIWEDADKIAITYQLQDDGRTLKVFVSDAQPSTPVAAQGGTQERTDCTTKLKQDWAIKRDQLNDAYQMGFEAGVAASEPTTDKEK